MYMLTDGGPTEPHECTFVGPARTWCASVGCTYLRACITFMHVVDVVHIVGDVVDVVQIVEDVIDVVQIVIDVDVVQMAPNEIPRFFEGLGILNAYQIRLS